MDDIELYTLGNMTNSSRAMFARRRRILAEARKMIGEEGLEGFNIRVLCKRAGVASRTLYYAFESKENIIALAIKGYFEAFDRAMKPQFESASFAGALEYQVTTTLRNQAIPNYVRAVAALYFSPSLHPDIRKVLLDIGTCSWGPWLETIMLQRQIKKGVDLRGLLLDISNLQFAKVHEWGLGELDDDAFLDRTLDGVLLLLLGATRGVAQSDASAAFNRLKRSPEFRELLVRNAQARISIIPAEHNE